MMSTRMSLLKNKLLLQILVSLLLVMEVRIFRNQAHAQDQEYTCGRPQTNKKLASLLFQGSSSSSLRSKYRPFEIRTPRIIGGDETSPGEFPWTVSVKLNGQPICGGSLIDNNWILTAAHCVVGYNPKNLTVRLGAYRIKDTTETHTVNSDLSMFIVHKQYSMPRPFSNDIALLKMSAPIQFSDFIIPICLPNEDRDLGRPTSPLQPISGNDLVVDDFDTNFKSSNTMNDGSHQHQNQQQQEDLGGIVVSTKMSDKEISRCFKRLEQNYLNSIGLGTPEVISSGGNDLQQSDEELAAAAAPIQANHHGHDHQQQQQQQHAPPMPIDLLPISHHSHPTYNTIHFEEPDQKAALAAIKLTSLPISKELLREIQSVGSMQSLNLGLHQGDFVAMASDLVASNDAGASVLPTGNANRERVITTSVNNNSNNNNGDASSSASSTPTRQSIRYPVRASGESISSANELDDGNFLAETQHDAHRAKYEGESAIVVGWGWVRENNNDEQSGAGSGSANNKGHQSVTLQKVRLPILRNSDCEAWFRSQEKKITLLPSQFCAGYNLGGKDACRGDSGGPMIIEDSSDSGRYKLIGIVSAGIGCARPSLPGLYTRVVSFLPWINAQLARY